jgi:type IV pilus assembly protein PilW
MRRLRPFAGMRGFSLIEVMVGMMIGLIGCIVIFQVFSVNERYKRSTTSGSDAQIAGALAIFTLERELKMAGFGVSDRVALGCNMLGYTSTRSPTSYNLTLAPVQIHAGPDAATPDIISVNQGAPFEFVPGTALINAHMAPAGNFRVENRAGVRKWDFLLAFQPAQANCSLLNATNLPQDPAGSVVACGGANNSDTVEICPSTSKTDYDGVQRQYNPAGGLTGAPTYTVATGVTNTRFYNFGPEPIFNVYRVINNTLSVCNMRIADCASTAAANWQAVMENVVFMKAYYGMDTNDDGRVDTYDPRVCRDLAGVAGYTAAAGDNFGDQWATSSDTNSDGLHDTWAPGAPMAYDWSRVHSVRIAIVVRSINPEREVVSPASLKLWPDDPAGSGSGCTGTALLGGADQTGPSWTVTDRNYRYRVFETIVPLRNSIWMPG